MNTADLLHLGTIGIQTLIFLAGVGAIIVRADSSTKSMGKRMFQMEEELKNLAKVITIQAVQTERLDQQAKRLNRLEETIEDLRRGRAWVQADGRKTVDGEY